MKQTDKIIRIQADRLAEMIGLPRKTFFTHDELVALADTDIGLQKTTFRGKQIPFSPSIKSLADILKNKISG